LVRSPDEHRAIFSQALERSQQRVSDAHDDLQTGTSTTLGAAALLVIRRHGAAVTPSGVDE